MFARAEKNKCYECQNSLILPKKLSIMKAFKMILPLLLAVNFACSHKSETYKQLVEVDSLILGHHNSDSAIQLLNKIEPKGKEESAYYNILEAAASYRGENPVKSFDGINASIQYYTDNYDARKLAYAYYYKSIIFIDSDSIIAEILLPLFKSAEQHAQMTTDYRLLERVYTGLTYTNERFGEGDEALKCAHNEYYYAKKLNDNYCIAYALVNLATIHHHMTHDSDSIAYYILQCKSFANEVEYDDRAYIYNYLGQIIMYDDKTTAKQYFSKALEYKKSTSAYLNLAKLYFCENNYDEALKYCDSTLIKPSLASREETYMLMTEYYYKNKDIEHYKRVIDELINTKTKISQDKENRKLLELQHKFDFEKQRAEYDIKIQRLGGILGLTAFISLIVFLLYRIRIRHTENNRMASELRYKKLKSNLVLYEERIAWLETEKKSQSKELDALKEKAAELKNAVMRNLQHGHNLYDQLTRCESAANWSDFDLLCLLDFVSTINPEFTLSLENNYNDLNVSQKLFLVVSNLLQKSDFEICQMLGLEKQSLRNKRNRISKKMKTEAYDK